MHTSLFLDMSTLHITYELLLRQMWILAHEFLPPNFEGLLPTNNPPYTFSQFQWLYSVSYLCLTLKKWNSFYGIKFREYFLCSY